jgi:ABC-type antimicrobial peptide transport system permease subunit
LLYLFIQAVGTAGIVEHSRPAVTMLMVVILIARYVFALRAAHVDPIEALRQQ